MERGEGRPILTYVMVVVCPQRQHKTTGKRLGCQLLLFLFCVLSSLCICCPDSHKCTKPKIVSKIKKQKYAFTFQVQYVLTCPVDRHADVLTVRRWMLRVNARKKGHSAHTNICPHPLELITSSLKRRPENVGVQKQISLT